METVDKHWQEYNLEPVLKWRGLSWVFRRNWYGVRSGHYPQSQDIYWLMDVGAFTLGFRFIHKGRR